MVVMVETERPPLLEVILIEVDDDEVEHDMTLVHEVIEVSGEMVGEMMVDQVLDDHDEVRERTDDLVVTEEMLDITRPMSTVTII